MKSENVSGQSAQEQICFLTVYSSVVKDISQSVSDMLSEIFVSGVDDSTDCKNGEWWQRDKIGGKKQLVLAGLTN